MDFIELSVFSKDYGNLTKDIYSRDGEIIKDASGCRMASGTVKTQSVNDLLELKDLLSNLGSNQAIALGTCGVDNANICLKGQEIEGSFARIKDNFAFRPKRTLWLLDYDPEKGKPALSIDEVRILLIKIMSAFAGCEMLALGSTSSSIYRDNEPIPETLTGGIHFYIIVKDGTKIPELGKLLTAHSWLKDFGRYDISKSGALLPRVLFDEAVSSAERLIFEAAPILGAGLKQLPRVSKYWPGGDFDPENIKSLSDSEENRIESLKQDAKAEKQPEADIIKGVQTKVEVARLVSIGVNKSLALEQVKNSYNHVLTGAHQLRVSI